MNHSTVSLRSVMRGVRRLFAKRVGLRGLIHCCQIFCMALGIAFLHMQVSFLSDLWPLGAISLTVCGLGSQMYAEKAKMITKAILIQFLLGSAIGLAICVIFPGQWYFSLIGIFLAYAIWEKIRPRAFSGLAAVIVNVLFFDFLVRDGQMSAVLIGAGVIIAEALLGMVLAVIASRIVNVKASSALIRLARDMQVRYEHIFMEVMEKKRFRPSIIEVRLERLQQMAVEARMIEKVGEEKQSLIVEMVGAADNAYYHLYTFAQVKMNFTQRVKDTIKPSAALYKKIQHIGTEQENEFAGLSYLHMERFVRDFDVMTDSLRKLEGSGHAG